MTNLNEKISSLSSYTHDALFKKYENITLYKITSDILESGENSSLNKLLTLYTSNNNFKYNLTHQPKIYEIKNSEYSTNPINADYFEKIEGWLNENNENTMNDLTRYFSDRGSSSHGGISSCIFNDNDDYNLAPIKIDAIANLNNLTNINVNTLATVYKYLLRINGTLDNPISENLKDMLDSLKGKITSLSNGLTEESNISHIEKSLMNQATFKIVAKVGEDLSTALNIIDTKNKSYPNSWYDGGILYAHRNDNNDKIDRIYFTNNCDVRHGGLSGNGITELIGGTRVLSYYHHQQKYFYYEDIDTEDDGKVKATLPMCKIYLNLDTCMNIANSFGIGYTTDEATGFYFMVNIKPGFRDYVKKLNINNDKYLIKRCLDGNWLDICEFIGLNKDNIDGYGIYIEECLNIRLYSGIDVNNIEIKPIGTDTDLIVYDSKYSNWYLNPACNYAYVTSSYNRSKADEFRLAQYYNNGNILGFFAETDERENETSNEKKYHPLAIYRSDSKVCLCR